MCSVASDIRCDIDVANVFPLVNKIQKLLDSFFQFTYIFKNYSDIDEGE